jgi:hypothetical protein
MIFIRFILLLLFLYLVVRSALRLLFRVLGIRTVISSTGSRQPGRVSNDSPGAMDAEYEVIESHIREDGRRE